MNILAFDCSSTKLNIVLSKENKKYIRIYEEGLNHSARLMPAIISVLEDADISPKELDLIACTAGPGSFTGLRIAMATAKGLASSTGKPFVSFSTLEYLSMGFEKDELIVPVLDGKKNRLYCAIYKNGDLVQGPWDISVEELVAKIEDFDSVLVSGPDANLLADYAGSKIKINPNYKFINSEFLLDLAVTNYKKNGPDSDESGPFYIRKSQAEE